MSTCVLLRLYFFNFRVTTSNKYSRQDPNKPMVRIYSLPEGTFSSEEEEDSEEDSDEDGSEDETKAAER